MWDRIDEEMVKLDDSLEIGDAFEAFSSRNQTWKISRAIRCCELSIILSFK